MEQPAIRMEGLTKRFGRETLAVDSIDLEVPPGSVFGFIGPNGAGKTTTIRMMCDLIRPTSGRVLVLGSDPRRDGATLRQRIGYLPGELRLDERLTPSEALAFFSNLRGVPVKPALELAERFDLPLDRKIGELSRGNKQKVGIVQAFAHDPDLVILDEPTSGLDPILQRSFQELLTDRVGSGLTAFMSSHVLSELQQVATVVGMVKDGRLLAVRTVEEMSREAPHKVQVKFTGPPPAGFLDGIDGIRDVEVDGATVRLLSTGPMDRLVKALAEHEIVELHSTEPDLEETFLRLYEDGPSS